MHLAPGISCMHAQLWAEVRALVNRKETWDKQHRCQQTTHSQCQHQGALWVIGAWEAGKGKQKGKKGHFEGTLELRPKGCQALRLMLGRKLWGPQASAGEGGKTADPKDLW